MTPLRELPELVRDAELQVEIRDNTTIHNEPLGCRDDSSPQVWETKRMIGHGGDGTVFLQHKVEGPGTMNMMAVKQMSLNADLASEDHNSKRYVRELEALAKFAQERYSRYFVRSYGWYQEDGWLYICMEYCKHLDLGKHLKTHGPLPEESARIIASQILQGIIQMHKNRIAHRDLKPANILIQRKRPEDDTWWVVLGDLGLSRRSGTSSGSTTIRGTPSFMAPETIGIPFSGDPRSADPFPADMWCLGETISCVLTGHGTFSSNEQLLRYQQRNEPFPDGALKKSGASSDAIDFIRSLMDVDPLQRLTATQALNHPWIKANHTSYTRTVSAAAISAMHAIGGETLIPLERPESAPPSLEGRTTLSDNEETQASAQFTQTEPMPSSTTQSPEEWYEAVETTEIQRDTLIYLDKQIDPEDDPRTIILHTENTPTLVQPPSLSSPKEANPNFGGNDQRLKVAFNQTAPQLLEEDPSDTQWQEDYLLYSRLLEGDQLSSRISEEEYFESHLPEADHHNPYTLRSYTLPSVSEEPRVSERQMRMALEDEDATLGLLKRFGLKFGLEDSLIQRILLLFYPMIRRNRSES